MDDRQEVILAAEARAEALARGDAAHLSSLLHTDFRWTSHTGDSFDRDDYVRRNTSGAVAWQSQQLCDIEVIVVPGAAVLRAEVVDTVGGEVYRMPVTQVWVHGDSGWVCLAGHAGPRRA